MKLVFYICYILGLFLLISGIILSLIVENCYNKTPMEFFESKTCPVLVRK